MRDAYFYAVLSVAAHQLSLGGWLDCNRAFG